MQYHALALAVNDVDVDLIGEEGAPLPDWLHHPRITVHRLRARRGIAGVAGSALALFGALRRLRRPDVIVAQTPPAIPTIVVAWAAARLRGSRLILDWHNLGWTLLAPRDGRPHLLTAVARAIERASARLADAHLAVSSALAAHLQSAWGLRDVHVLRDRPGDHFGNAAAADSLRPRLLALAGLPDDARPAIVISPTSWTRDEALDLVIPAADALDVLWRDRGPADGLIIVISGRGAGRAAFEQRLATRTTRRVHVVTTWVSGDEYPALIAAADAGLSLHRSSSGLDLPMKICDLFGAALPVCALDYGATLRELITPDRDSVVFTDAHELAACLDVLFETWPGPSALWQRLRDGASSVASGPRWVQGWQTEARAVIITSAP
jgi:beta-1,4-mannosyltransferase